MHQQKEILKTSKSEEEARMWIVTDTIQGKPKCELAREAQSGNDRRYNETRIANLKVDGASRNLNYIIANRSVNAKSRLMHHSMINDE